MRKFIQKPHVWGFTTYFAEGFPYTLIRAVIPVYFRDRHVSLESIGLTSLYGIPWIVKFLWAPHLDSSATKRTWMNWMQLFLTGIFAAVALLTVLPQGIPIIAAVLLLGSFLAATNDIAIDGYYLEALDKDGQAKFIGYRVMAYRLAMMTGTGVIVTVGVVAGWFYAFAAGAFLVGLLCLYHWFLLPRVETEKKPLTGLIRKAFSLRNIGWTLLLAGCLAALYLGTQSDAYLKLGQAYPAIGKLNFSAWISILLVLALAVIAALRKRIAALVTNNPESFYSKAFVSYMAQERIGALLVFIILIRAGEYMLSAMAAPFMVDLGIKLHYGWISGGVGLPCSIIGAMVGGWMISRWGMRKVLWPFLLAQNLTNLVYMALAFHLAHFVALNTGVETPTAIGTANLVTVAVVHGFDQLSGGLGTAVLQTFLMRLCTKEYKAAHYAIGSGLMSVFGVFSGVLSGFIAARAGYAYFFGVSFLFSVPGMLSVFWLPKEPPLEKKVSLLRS